MIHTHRLGRVREAFVAQCGAARRRNQSIIDRVQQVSHLGTTNQCWLRRFRFLSNTFIVSASTETVNDQCIYFPTPIAAETAIVHVLLDRATVCCAIFHARTDHVSSQNRYQYPHGGKLLCNRIYSQTEQRRFLGRESSPWNKPQEAFPPDGALPLRSRQVVPGLAGGLCVRERCTSHVCPTVYMLR